MADGKRHGCLGTWLKKSKEPQGQNLLSSWKELVGIFLQRWDPGRDKCPLPPTAKMLLCCLAGGLEPSPGRTQPASSSSYPNPRALTPNTLLYLSIFSPIAQSGRSQIFLLPILFFFASFIERGRIHKPRVPLTQALPLEHQLFSVHTYYQLRTKPCFCAE